MIARSFLVLTLALAACSSPDPLARGDVRDLDRTWFEIRAGVRDGDAARIQAVAAPTADAEIGLRVLLLLTATDDGRAIRETLLRSDVGALEPHTGAVPSQPDVQGQILTFEASQRTPAADGFPASDSGLTLFIQLDGDNAHLLETLAWSRIVRDDSGSPE